MPSSRVVFNYVLQILYVVQKYCRNTVIIFIASYTTIIALGVFQFFSRLLNLFCTLLDLLITNLQNYSKNTCMYIICNKCLYDVYI